MSSDPDKKNLTNDEFLDKHIAKSIKVSDKDIDGFIKGRGRMITDDNHIYEGDY